MFHIKRPIEYLIYLGVPLLVYLGSSSNLFIAILTADALFSAIHLLRSFMFQGLSEAKLVYDSNCVYEVPMIRRYLYYLGITLLYTLICNIFWFDQLSLLRLVFFYSVSPPVLKWITDRFLHPLFQHLEYEQRRLVKNLIGQQLANFLNFFAANYLQEEVHLEARDFTKLFLSYDRAVSESWALLKNILLTTVFRYGKNNMGRRQFQLVKTIYQYKTGNYLGTFSAEEARLIVKKVLQERKWERLLDHDICNAIIKLYQMQEDDTDLWAVITEQVHHKMLSMLSVWIIVAFSGQMWLILVFNLLFRWLRKGKKLLVGGENQLKLIMVAGGTILGYQTRSFLLGTFGAEFGYLILVNRVTRALVRQFLHRGRHLIAILHHTHRYLYFLSFTILYLWCVRYLESYNFYLSVINVIYVGCNLDDHNKQWMLGLLTFTGIFSSFHPLHLLHNAYGCYLITNGVQYLKHYSEPAPNPVLQLEQKMEQLGEQWGLPPMMDSPSPLSLLPSSSPPAPPSPSFSVLSTDSSPTISSPTFSSLPISSLPTSTPEPQINISQLIQEDYFPSSSTGPSSAHPSSSTHRSSSTGPSSTHPSSPPVPLPRALKKLSSTLIRS